jgi:mono/diheme cytochrome c family protein
MSCRSFRLALAAAALLAFDRAPLSAQAAGAAPPQRSASEGVFTEGQAQRGEVVFRQVCAACHGLGDFNGEAWLKRWPTAGGLFDVISSTMPQDNPGGLSPQQYADVIAFFLKSNGFRTGPEELPREAAPLNAIAIPPRPPR